MLVLALIYERDDNYMLRVCANMTCMYTMQKSATIDRLEAKYPDDNY